MDEEKKENEKHKFPTMQDAIGSIYRVNEVCREIKKNLEEIEKRAAAKNK